ncbi:mucin-13-like isoform X2 [Babylonia areolata]|uniref:mucin-13-like isoform X2 n=1 Tax=Babylonia areolata TaxID=304850 RepID=UPI003FD09C62
MWVSPVFFFFVILTDASGQTTTSTEATRRRSPFRWSANGDGDSTPPFTNNMRALSDGAVPPQSQGQGHNDVTTPPGGARQCDVSTHSGCKVEKFERCLEPGFCGCLKGYIRKDSGDCVAAQFFHGQLSVVDTDPDQILTAGSAGYNTLVVEITTVVLRALTSQEARGVLHVQVTSVSRENGRLLIGWEVAVTAASNWHAEKLTRVYNEGIVNMSYVDPKNRLLKLNGSDLVLGHNDTLSAFLKPISEFSHCVDKQHNYCDVNANCVHSLGSFTCTCRQGFDDVSPDVRDTPGERCTESCSCENDGACKRDSSGNKYCECPDWYIGSNCETNGKDILIITVCVVGALVVLVVVLCLVRHCLAKRSRKSGGGGSGVGGVGGGGSTVGVGSSLDTSLVKLPRVWMDAPRFYDPPPRDKRRWSFVSDPVKYLDEYTMDDYVHAGTLPLPRSHDAKKKYYAAYPMGTTNHGYSTLTLPARPFPRY